MTARTRPAVERGATLSLSPAWLALLAGPLSFGITGPALVLTDIARDLDVSMAGATCVVTAFGWGIAVGTPLAGVLLARRGLRVALAVSALLVAAGSAVVGTVPVLAPLLLGTALQALGAAGSTVAALSIAGSATAMGTVTASLAVFGSVAPLVGTRVADTLGWPVALVLPALSLLAVPAALRAAAPPPVVSGTDGVDRVGAALLVGWVTALVLLTMRPFAAVAGVLVLTVLLAVHLRRRPLGFVPVELVRRPRFLVSAGLAFGLAVVNFGIIYTAPAKVAALTGATSMQLGLALLGPYLGGGTASWFLVSRSARLRFPVLVAVLAAGGAGAVAVVVLANGMIALLFAGMLLGALAAATGQGALGLRAGEAASGVRPTAMGLFNLCYLLGVAFGPAIAAPALG